MNIVEITIAVNYKGNTMNTFYVWGRNCRSLSQESADRCLMARDPELYEQDAFWSGWFGTAD